MTAMPALAKTHMSVDEYLAWAQDHPGRYELFRGDVFAMSPEGAHHARIKFAIQTALAQGIRSQRLPCEMLPDGMTVRVNDDTAYEPDALVYCGPRISSTTLEVSNPIVIVEVLSPSTRHIDAARKLGDYFQLPSVVHYLIVDPLKPLILHHVRAAGSETILTHIVTEGTIVLDPPGITLVMADAYGDADP
jgi:Uma2 family endonuclease